MKFSRLSKLGSEELNSLGINNRQEQRWVGLKFDLAAPIGSEFELYSTSNFVIVTDKITGERVKIYFGEE